MTFAQVMASIRTARKAYETNRFSRPLPNDSADGGYVSVTYTVTNADDLAGEALIKLPLTEIKHFIVQIRSAAGILKDGDQVVTQDSMNEIKVEDGSSTSLAATDLITIIARGKK